MINEINSEKMRNTINAIHSNFKRELNEDLNDVHPNSSLQGSYPS